MVNFTLKDMFHDPIKIVLIIMGLAVSFLMVHVSYGMMNGTLSEYTLMIEKSNYDAYIVQKNRPNIMMGGSVSDQIYEEVANDKSVKHIDRIIDDWSGVRFEGEDAGVIICGIDIQNSHLQPWDIIEGDIDDLNENNKIIVDQILWKYFPGLEIGDKIIGGVLDDELEVIGICQNARRVGNAIIWTNYETAKKLLYMENESTYLAVEFKDGYSINNLDYIEEKYEDQIRIYTAEDMKERIYDFILNDMGMGGSIGLLAYIGFVVSMIVISITLYQSVSQKISELITLKALGARKSKINGILIGQTFILVSISYAISVIIAMIIAPYLTSVATLSIAVNPITTILNYFVALGLGVFCSVFSIRKVHKTDPALIFRG